MLRDKRATWRRVKAKNALSEKKLQTMQKRLARLCKPCKEGASQPAPEALMLKLLSTQPPEAPAKHEALVILAKCRAQLENCPDDRNGNWHEAATTAWTAMLQFERMVAQLIDLQSEVTGSIAHEAIDNAIEQLCDTAGTLTEEAKRRAEDDAVNGAFYREIDNWNMRRGSAQ
jgi:hypothetical protein